jgi:radical SAM protein (TIGR01212 family)
MRKALGSRVQKLSVDAGFTCPNRDGTKGLGGCTFCLNDAFNPSYCSPDKPVRQQLLEGIAFHENRYRKAKNYLAYFQAFSNTHAPVARLQSLYREALKVHGVIGLVIGTRPDCIDDARLDLLGELAKECYLVVEYGIESVYNETLRRVNRCHTWEDTKKAIEITAARGIKVGGHMIFGLPGENTGDMLASAATISKLPLHSIKFHQLQIFRTTPMELEYRNNPGDFSLFTMEGYLDFMVSYVEKLNPSFVIERIAGEAPPRYSLVRPWGPRYDQILATFEKLLKERDTWQGKMFTNEK